MSKDRELLREAISIAVGSASPPQVIQGEIMSETPLKMPEPAHIYGMPSMVQLRSYEELRDYALTLQAALSAAEQRAEAMQARIDELMLEYCPDEMTPEQINEWGKHQKPVSEETAKRIDAAMQSDKGEG